MKLTKIYSLILLFLVAGVSHAQDGETEARKPGHTNENKFKQLQINIDLRVVLQDLCIISSKQIIKWIFV
jgi:hypothetical protein